MIIEKTYYFNKEDFNTDGFNKVNGQLFLEYIADCENDFFKEKVIFIANCFFANSSTMYLIKRCIITEENDDFGMELIEGEINLDVNLKIEKHSKRKTTYAIGSKIKGNEDEPLYLVIDEEIKDGSFVLKYIADNDDDDDGCDDDGNLDIIVPVYRNANEINKN